MRPERQGPRAPARRARIDTEKRGDGMKRTVLAALIALGAASCASRIRADYYLIDTEPSPPRAAERLPLTVAVNNVRAPSPLPRPDELPRPGLRAGFYSTAAGWSRRPRWCSGRCATPSGSRASSRADHVQRRTEPGPRPPVHDPRLRRCGRRTASTLAPECALAMELVQPGEGERGLVEGAARRVPQGRGGAGSPGDERGGGENARQGGSATWRIRRTPETGEGCAARGIRAAHGSPHTTDRTVNFPCRAGRLVFRTWQISSAGLRATALIHLTSSRSRVRELALAVVPHERRQLVPNRSSRRPRR